MIDRVAPRLRRASWLVGSGALACGLGLACRPGPAREAPPTDPVDAVRAPLAVCPAGSLQRGAAPPEGLRVWCENDEGVEHGPVVSFFPEGRRKAEGRYADGQLDGMWSFYDEHGQLRERREYAAGRPTGVWAQWFEGGERASETTYDDDGVAFVAWHRNGAKRLQGRHDDAQEHGVWTQWDERGQVVTDVGPVDPIDAPPSFEVGISECDRYVVGMLRCIESMPGAARDSMREAVATSAQAWRTVSADQREALIQACTAALDAARRATQAYGCEW